MFKKDESALRLFSATKYRKTESCTVILQSIYLRPIMSK